MQAAADVGLCVLQPGEAIAKTCEHLSSAEQATTNAAPEQASTNAAKRGHGSCGHLAVAAVFERANVRPQPRV